ncbi:MAG: hypothetical protein K2X82_18920 [Gemmataceae bacterium]|nr:hypothetical protein [Gemmataceae bacterium]
MSDDWLVIFTQPQEDRNMGFDWITSWLGGGGKPKGPPRRARLTVLPAVLLVAAGLAVAADPLPVAPPPREAKPAKVKVDPKLLLGKWRAVATAPQPLAPTVTMTFEFAASGRYQTEILIDGDRPQRPAGAYVVDGDSIRFQPDVPSRPEEPTWGWTVMALTPDRLDVAGQCRFEHQRSFYVRVREK